jgi:hypothetical protein
MNKIDVAIKLNLVTDFYESEKPIYFRPCWLVDKNISRYAVNKYLKKIKAEGLIEYVVLGGGCDEDLEPSPPWHGYRVTEKYLEKLEEME